MNYRDQEVSQIRLRCTRTGTLFTDPEFPACLSSLGCDQEKLENLNVCWRRPAEICTHPRLMNYIRPSPARQGRLGNCWFVAACACLMRNPSVLKTVLITPRYNHWDKYCGAFEFRFWRFGVWVTVVVDDRLPTLDGELLYCRAYQADEFWCSLLEKAYAKLLGSYEALEGGELADALVDFTGGFPECLKFCQGKVSGLSIEENCLNEPVAGFNESDGFQRRSFNSWNNEKLFDTLTRYHLNGTLIAAAISGDYTTDEEQETELGLVVGHAYAVIRMCAFPAAKINSTGRDCAVINQTRSVLLVCLTNPWGHGQWKGAFSRGSSDWKTVRAEFRGGSGIECEDDGVFWMRFEDFLTQFNYIVLCHTAIGGSWFRFIPDECSGILSRDSRFNSNPVSRMNAHIANSSPVECGHPFAISSSHHPGRLWREIVFHGSWDSNTSGGCLNYLRSFIRNPQFAFDVLHVDRASLSIYLLQKTARILSGTTSTTGLYHIGLCLFRIEANRTTHLNTFTQVQFVANSLYRNSRAVWMRLCLERGRYCVIPTTFYPNCQADFMLRLVGVPPLSAFELDNEVRFCKSSVRPTRSNIHNHGNEPCKLPVRRRLMFSRRVRNWFCSVGDLLQWGCSASANPPMPSIAMDDVESVVRITLVDFVLQPLSVASVALQVNRSDLKPDGPLGSPVFYARLIHTGKTVESGLHVSKLTGRRMAHGLVRFDEAFLFEVGGDGKECEVIHVEVYIRQTSFDELHSKGAITLPSLRQPHQQSHQIALYPTGKRTSIRAFSSVCHRAPPISECPSFTSKISSSQNKTGYVMDLSTSSSTQDLKVVKQSEQLDHSIGVVYRSAFEQSEKLLNTFADGESLSSASRCVADDDVIDDDDDFDDNSIPIECYQDLSQKWNDGRCGLLNVEISRLYTNL